MDTWLKALVAAASVVVIAGGGYYGWSEYQAAVAAKAAEKERSMRSACRQADANRNQLSVMYDFCYERGYYD